MKNISLRPIAIPLPRDTDPELRRTLQRLEETLRANNAEIEDAFNEWSGASYVSSDGAYDSHANDGFLEKTYTTNSYVTEASFNRIYAWRHGDMVQITLNLNISSLPTQSDFITIGKLKLPTGMVFPMSILQTIPGQTNSTNISARITYDGMIQIYNGFSDAASGWYRACVTAILIPIEQYIS